MLSDPGARLRSMVRIRAVDDADLATFYDHQADPEVKELLVNIDPNNPPKNTRQWQRASAAMKILDDADIGERQAEIDIRLDRVPELGQKKIDIGFGRTQAEPIKAAIDDRRTEQQSGTGDAEEGEDDPRAGRHGSCLS